MSQLSIYGVRFKKATRVIDFDGTGVEIAHGDQVIVEVEKGLGMGVVVNGPREPVRAGKKIQKIIRRAGVTDIERFSFNTEREDEAFRICKEKITKYNLPMKLVSVEYLFDSSKAIFYFTSETRVDFRGLVKDLASAFHTRIEMRQIGVRDEAKMIGGLGPCGRALCCASFLSNFEPVTIKMAKDQNLALNPVKISGVCGRLMCCLSFEHEAYKKGKAGGSKGAHGAGHGCHKGESKERHCGAHGGAKHGNRGAEKQPQEKRDAQRQPRERQSGERPAGEREGRSDRSKFNRNRPNRNRPNRARGASQTEAGGREEQGNRAETVNRPSVAGTATSVQQGEATNAEPRRPESEGKGRNRNRNRIRNRNRNRSRNRNSQQRGNSQAQDARGANAGTGATSDGGKPSDAQSSERQTGAKPVNKPTGEE